jgi:hypothetical protein
LEFIMKVAGRGGRSVALEFTGSVATAFVVIGAPGRQRSECTFTRAGRGGRSGSMEFIRHLATAFENRAPGTPPLEINAEMAGRGGRILDLECISGMATAFVKRCARQTSSGVHDYDGRARRSHLELGVQPRRGDRMPNIYGPSA